MPLRCRHASFFVRLLDLSATHPRDGGQPLGAAASAGRKPPKKNSEVIFSTSEIKKITSDVEKTISEVVGAVSEVGGV